MAPICSGRAMSAKTASIVGECKGARVTGAQLRKAREKLGLTREQMATLLGYEGKNLAAMLYDLESGRRAVREPQRRLVEAYLSGYVPRDLEQVVGRKQW